MKITAKCRILDTLENTKSYVKLLCDTGISGISIHGRQRHQRGPNTGLADWVTLKSLVTFIRENYPNIAIIMNGNIQSLIDVKRCIDFTKCDGVMSAEGILHNPALFSGESPAVIEIAKQFLKFVIALQDNTPTIPTPNSVARLHLFKILTHILNDPNYHSFRDKLAQASTFTAMNDMVLELEELLPKVKKSPETPKFMRDIMRLPNHFVKPYLRPSQTCICTKEYDQVLGLPIFPIVSKPDDEDIVEFREKCTRCGASKIKYVSKEEAMILEEKQREKKKELKENSENKKSNKRKSKRQKLDKSGLELDPVTGRYIYPTCLTCKCPASSRCPYKSCRQCCKKKCVKELLDCVVHHFNLSRKRLPEPVNKKICVEA